MPSPRSAASQCRRGRPWPCSSEPCPVTSWKSCWPRCRPRSTSRSTPPSARRRHMPKPKRTPRPTNPHPSRRPSRSSTTRWTSRKLRSSWWKSRRSLRSPPTSPTRPDLPQAHGEFRAHLCREEPDSFCRRATRRRSGSFRYSTFHLSY